MQTVPQVVPVSELRNKHCEVFALLNKGPIILAQRSKAAAMLVSVEEWDQPQIEHAAPLGDNLAQRCQKDRNRQADAGCEQGSNKGGGEEWA